MTAEEIKSQYSMKDVLQRYGLQVNRAGFMQCPFHQGDRNPSLKVYDHDFHCYGCGAHGDIFGFVQLMEGCSFKEAFQILGGTFEHRNSLKVALAEATKRDRERAIAKKYEQMMEAFGVLQSCREALAILRESKSPLLAAGLGFYYKLQEDAIEAEDSYFAEKGRGS